MLEDEANTRKESKTRQEEDASVHHYAGVAKHRGHRALARRVQTPSTYPLGRDPSLLCFKLCGYRRKYKCVQDVAGDSDSFDGWRGGLGGPAGAGPRSHSRVDTSIVRLASICVWL